MANNNQQISSRKINKQIDNLNTTVDNLYNTVYSTRVDNQKDLDRITDNIDDNLNELLSSVNNQNVSNLSSLLIRLQRKTGNGSTKELNSQLAGLMSDKSIIDNVNLENIQKYIQAENYQYDLILKYVPKLMEAIEIMKDNVLSSDNFSKDFINIQGNQGNENENNIFNSRSKKLINKYNIQELFEEMYIKTAKYGEYFLYEVPYKQAFQRLIDRQQAPEIMKENTLEKTMVPKNDSARFITRTIFESSKFNDFIKESGNKEEFSTGFAKNLLENNSKVVLKMDTYGIVPEAIKEVGDAIHNIKRINPTSLTETFMESVLTEDGEETNNTFHRGVGALKYDNSLAMSYDGMMSPISSQDSNDSEKIRDMIGCVLYEIPRENIIPLYIGDYCIGYYYFSIENDYVSKQVMLGNTYNSITASSEIKDTEIDKQNDLLISTIAKQISQQIDAKFINNNIDLKEEIYAILRYNDKFITNHGINTISISFLPASDVHHFYFELDKKTHRGISDLKDSVVPAMLYALLYLTDIINKVSRSQDHRVYYVKQNIETNVARTMLNVISQLKKGNMGIRQLENMNTIFNVIGKYNDFVIPIGQSGEAPIQFEVMPGQQTETPTELMDRMEEAAVNRTDVPYEFVQSVNQVDFATRFTMSNSKFLRKVFKRQMKCQRHFTEIFRKIYNFEYNENETSMEVRLPAPAFLTMTNSQQLLDNTKNLANAIAEVELTDQEDLKPEFIRLMMRNYLGGSYLDYGMIDGLIEQAKQNFNIETTKKQDVSGLEDMSGDDEGI